MVHGWHINSSPGKNSSLEKVLKNRRISYFPLFPPSLHRPRCPSVLLGVGFHFLLSLFSFLWLSGWSLSASWSLGILSSGLVNPQLSSNSQERWGIWVDWVLLKTQKTLIPLSDDDLSPGSGTNYRRQRVRGSRNLACFLFWETGHLAHLPLSWGKSQCPFAPFHGCFVWVSTYQVLSLCSKKWNWKPPLQSSSMAPVCTLLLELEPPQTYPWFLG